MTTPLRRLKRETVDGVQLLVGHSADWRDGGEDEVLATLAEVRDRSVLSEELRHHEHSWETRYHFSSERAHIVRGLDLPEDAAVLERWGRCRRAWPSSTLASDLATPVSARDTAR